MPSRAARWIGALFIGMSTCLFAPRASHAQADSAQAAPSAPDRLPTLTPRSHEERERSYQAEHRVILNLEVTDGSGKPVPDLKEEDFTLLDNRQPTRIESFRAVQGGAARVHAILLLDTLNSNSKDIQYARKGVQKFLGQNRGRFDFPIAIAVLSNAGVRVSQPSQDGAALIADLERLSGGLRSENCADEAGDGGLGKPLTGGVTVAINGAAAMQPANQFSKMANCENQRFKLSLAQLRRLAGEEVNVPGRAILVWVGKGWPLLTGSEFSPDTAAMKRNLFDYRVELATALREAQITVDAVSFPDSLRDEEPHGEVDKALLGGVPAEEQASAASMALEVLAHDTGGLTLGYSKDIASSIGACLADAAFYYVLSFDSRPAEKAGEFHSLEVRVDKLGLKLRTNSAYYAQP